jgi:endonuclease/exonuclease/phosphatase (EEP) superfamily protein YafD
MILVLLPALLVSGAAVAGFLGGWWWAFDLLSNFRPQYAVAGSLFGIVLILGKWRKSGSAVLAVGLLNAGLVGLLWIGPPAPSGSVGESFTVMSFNVRANNEGRLAVFDYISRTMPDVVFLHESTVLWEDQARAADLGYQIYTVGQPGLIFSTLVLAPPGSGYQSFGFTTTEPRAVEVILERPEGPIRLLGTHPISPVTAERAGLRDAQIAWAAQWAADAGGAAVVTGDLNATQWSHAFRAFVSVSGMRDSTRGFGLQPTFPMDGNPLVRVQIDHLLHGSDLAVIDRRLGPRMGSDHAPLIVQLASLG